MCRINVRLRDTLWLSLIVLTVPAVVAAQSEQPAQPAAPDTKAAAPRPRPRLTIGWVLGSGPSLRDPESVHFLSFSPDGTLLASSDDENQVRVFDLATGEVVWSWEYPVLLPTSLGELVWPWTPLAAATWQGPQKWRLHSGYAPTKERPHGWPGAAGALFAPGGGELALVHNVTISNSHVIVDHGPQQLEVRPGVWLLGSYVHFFDGPKFGHERTLETEHPVQLPMNVTILHGLADLTVLRYAPNGKYFAAAYGDGTLRLWKKDATEPTAEVQAEGTAGKGLPVWSIAFSPRGNAIATIGQSGIVRVWSVPGLAPLQAFPGHLRAGFWVGFAPEGDRLASASTDGTMRVWNLETGGSERRIEWAQEIGEHPLFAFGDDSHSIFFAATREHHGVIGLFDPYTEKVVLLKPTDLGRITAFTRSPLGDMLAAADGDGNIRTYTMRLRMGPAAQ